MSHLYCMFFEWFKFQNMYCALISGWQIQLSERKDIPWSLESLGLDFIAFYNKCWLVPPNVQFCSNSFLLISCVLAYSGSQRFTPRKHIRLCCIIYTWKTYMETCMTLLYAENLQRNYLWKEVTRIYDITTSRHSIPLSC